MFIGDVSILIYIINNLYKMFSNKEDLKNWILDYIDIKGKKSLHIAINNSKVIKDRIQEYTSFLPTESKYNQRCYHIINELYEIPYCKYCKANKVNFNNRDKNWKYLEYCSSKCGRINDNSFGKYKETSLKKYGVDNYSKTKDFKDRMVKNNIEKYGTDWYQKSEDFKLKSVKTCLEKYGFTSYSKTNEFKKKIRESFLNNWGVDWYTKSKDFRDKFKKTCLEKYGFEHFMLDDFICNSFKKQFKSYILPSGESIKLQGYENFALDILFLNYVESDIVISNTDIREEIGIINYFIGDNEKVYLPDIYIKSQNKIIEVKSKWTYEIEIIKNKLKKEACLDMGMEFEFWIIDRNGKLNMVL